MSDAEAISEPKGHLDLFLRSNQVSYLRYLAEREDASLSAMLGLIIAACADGEGVVNPQHNRQIRLHLSIDGGHLAMLDLLATRWGLRRSDAVRRLVDSARANDPWIGREQLGAALP